MAVLKRGSRRKFSPCEFVSDIIIFRPKMTIYTFAVFLVSGLGVFLVVMDVMAVLGNNPRISEGSTSMIEPRRLFLHASIDMTPTVIRSPIELDAYGRPSESQLRREVLRNLQISKESSYRRIASGDDSSDEALPYRYNSERQNSGVALGTPQSSSATTQVPIKTAGSSNNSALEASSLKASTSKRDSEVFLASGKQLPEGSISQLPSQFADVDAAVQSLTLTLELSRSRRISKRIGCHWVMGKDALNLEGRPVEIDSSVPSTGPNTHSKVSRIQRLLRHRNDDGPKPSIVWHHEFGETKAWGQDR